MLPGGLISVVDFRLILAVLFQLCIDQSGVYHGHSRGVTKYNMANGKKRWHKGWTCSIFAGVQVNLMH